MNLCPLYGLSLFLIAGIGIPADQVHHHLAGGSLKVVLGHSFLGLEVIRITPFAPAVDGLVSDRANRLETGQV